ncbi:MAG: substrate-binding domain-containing protein [Muribaculaceae bacterium]|nr:substrate-binding domain-containing protein [Muribaculaceae bacterium]
MKRLFSVTFVIFALLLFAGCKEKNEPKFRIGVSQCSSDEWREKMNQEMIREMLFHDDSLIEIVSADDNNEKQIADIQSFIDRKFDLIIVAPNEAEALTPIVKKAYEAGIPVIIFDRRISEDYYTSYIDLDNKGIGYSAAQYASSLFPHNSQTKIFEITGLSGSTPAQERHRGFMEGLDSFPSLKLVASVDGEWDRGKASFLADSLLSLYPDTKLIYAHSDNMAIGVSELLKEKGREDITILGTDASPGQGMEAVRDGIIDATFIYPTEGHRIIKTAFAILEGEPFEKVVHIPSLSSVDKSNAEILLRQNDLLKEETNKVLLLDEINDQQETRYKNLTRFSNTILVLAIVLALILFLFILLLIRNRKLQRELELQNKTLIEERDRQQKLYQHLDEVLVKEDDFYNRFINIIKTQFADTSMSTDSIAQQLNLGPAQLTRKIKSLTHFTPVEILRNYRLEQARQLLLSSDKTINEITTEVGFSSPAYLTKCFREHFGMTPTDLRNS